jgi:hypothetical protein
MSWNHRIVRETKDGETFYKFAEVFYSDDGSLMGYSDVFMWSEDVEGMQWIADKLNEAAAKPPLDESEFPKEV